MPGQYRQRDHRPGPAPRPAPEPSGELVAFFDRAGYRGGPDTELRITVETYQDHPYISARVWQAGPDGEFYPTRKGISIRVNEVERVAAALLRGLEIVKTDRTRQPAGQGRGEPYRLRPETNRTRSSPVRATVSPQRALPAPASMAVPAPAFDTSFDEFATS